MLVIFSQISLMWSQTSMSAFYGFGMAGKLDDPFYAMQATNIGLNAKTYADYSGLFYTIGFLPALIFGGPIIQSLPKAQTLGWCTFIWGSSSAMHGLVSHMW